MRLADFIEAATVETEPDRLWACATAWLEDLGFDRVLHLQLGADPGADPSAQGGFCARTTLGAEFERYYVDQGLAGHDPFPTYCLSAHGPIETGADYLDDYAYLSAGEREVILAAREAGFRSGFSSVTRRDSAGVEAWNVGSRLGRWEVERIRRARQGEIRLGLLALRGRLGGGGQDCPLSPRERQCLELLADGLRTKAIAHELGIAPITVELHLRNARSKLGAATREQAVATFVARYGPPPTDPAKD